MKFISRLCLEASLFRGLRFKPAVFLILFMLFAFPAGALQRGSLKLKVYTGSQDRAYRIILEVDSRRELHYVSPGTSRLKKSTSIPRGCETEFETDDFRIKVVGNSLEFWRK